MAHVQISKGDEYDTLKLVVDGVDLSKHVYTEGFGLIQVEAAPGETGSLPVWGVQVVIAADVLDVDLPDAVVKALRASEEPK